MTKTFQENDYQFYESDGMCPDVMCGKKKYSKWGFWMKTIIFSLLGFLCFFNLFAEDDTSYTPDLKERFEYLYTLIYYIDHNQSQPQYVAYLCELAHNKLFEIEYIINKQQEQNGVD